MVDNDPVLWKHRINLLTWQWALKNTWSFIFLENAFATFEEQKVFKHQLLAVLPHLEPYHDLFAKVLENLGC